MSEIFKRMALTYGRLFSDRWAGIDPEELKKHWAHSLGNHNAETIMKAIEGLDRFSFPPTLPEFKALCKSLDPQFLKPRFQRTQRGWEQYDDEYGWYVVHESDVPKAEIDRILRKTEIPDSDCHPDTAKEAV
jgi:hypothetical protein